MKKANISSADAVVPSTGKEAGREMVTSDRSEIVVYQPNDVMRLEVKLDDETVWLTQGQMGELFGCTTRNVRLHLENIYASGELDEMSTGKDFFLVRQEGNRRVSRHVTCYNLDAIISVGYRVNSVKGVQFRKWATNVLREHLLKGCSFNARMNQLEDKVDRRLAKHDADIVDLKEIVSHRRVIEGSRTQMLCLHETRLWRDTWSQGANLKYAMNFNRQQLKQKEVCQT